MQGKENNSYSMTLDTLSLGAVTLSQFQADNGNSEVLCIIITYLHRNNNNLKFN